MVRTPAPIIAALFFLSIVPETFAATITVCSAGCTTVSIQEAIKTSAAGDEIRVQPGLYSASAAILIDKPLQISAEPGTIITGSGTDNIFSVTADNVSLEGFQIKDTGFSYTHELAAIRAEGVSHCTIRRNTLSNNAYGIYLADSSYCLVSNNNIEGSRRSEVEGGNGIHSWKGNHHQIEKNQVSGHRDGIYLEFTNDSVIARNNVLGNERYGLHFMTSHRNEYRCNRFEQNGAGVAVMYSRQIKMIENIFSENRGVAAYGLLLKDISQGEISRNKFLDNTIGIYMEDTNRTKFSENSFSENGFGLRILGNCDDNTLRENYFSANTFDVATNSSRNPNTFEENYWAQYGGYDLNRDGSGDLPFRPVSLSSVIIEKLDSSSLLVKSPLFLMLDQLEQAFPMLTPESLKDERPLMKPIRRDSEGCGE